MCKKCTLLFVVARLLQILQQISSQCPAGRTGCVTQSLHLRQGLILNVSASKALLLRGHIQITGQQGTGMGAKV
nr:MAG TPA: hypothetical protein [Caudoviricetes sp.]